MHVTAMQAMILVVAGVSLSFLLIRRSKRKARS